MSFARVFSLGLMTVAIGSCSFAPAQASSGGLAGGMVMGHVILGDTQRPARYAQVILFGLPKGPVKDPATGDANMAMAETGADGGFVANNVYPGDYYVFASVAGYMQLRDILQAAYDAGDDLSKPIPGIPRVHVTAESSTRADVRLERGAAISGRVVWDDGNPVTHAFVAVVSAKDPPKPLPVEFAMLGQSAKEVVAVSDDLGRFRIAGLSPGDYVIQVTFEPSGLLSTMRVVNGVTSVGTSEFGSALMVFAPSVLRKKEAKVVTLHSAEEHGGEDVTIDLSGLHTVSGRVASMEDHHMVNSGNVRIEDAKDKEFSRWTTVNADGSFFVTFVPPGVYNLAVTNVADTTMTKKEPSSGSGMEILTDEAVRTYQDGKQSVIVGDVDVTGLSFELTPVKGAAKSLDVTEQPKN